MAFEFKVSSFSDKLHPLRLNKVSWNERELRKMYLSIYNIKSILCLRVDVKYLFNILLLRAFSEDIFRL